jgi:hypothetical protein
MDSRSSLSVLRLPIPLEAQHGMLHLRSRSFTKTVQTGGMRKLKSPRASSFTRILPYVLAGPAAILF